MRLKRTEIDNERNGAFKLPRLVEWPDGDHIAFFDWTHVIDPQSQHGLRSSRSRHELDLQAVGFVTLDHSAKVTTTEPVLRDVSSKDNGLKQFISHGLAPGNAVTNLGASSPVRIIQTDTT